MAQPTSLPENRLRDCPALAGLSALALKELRASAEERNFVAGDLLIRQRE